MNEKMNEILAYILFDDSDNSEFYEVAETFEKSTIELLAKFDIEWGGISSDFDDYSLFHNGDEIKKLWVEAIRSDGGGSIIDDFSLAYIVRICQLGWRQLFNKILEVDKMATKHDKYYADDKRYYAFIMRCADYIDNVEHIDDDDLEMMADPKLADKIFDEFEEVVGLYLTPKEQKALKGMI